MGRLAGFESLRLPKPHWLRVLLILFLWLMLLDFPSQLVSRALDPSWKRCLGHFLSHGYQCGVGYVWTYGPLGYFIWPIYDADLFWWKCAWEACVKFAFAWLLLSWADLLPRRWMRIVFITLAYLFLPGTGEVLYLFCLILLGLLPWREEGWRRPSRLAFAAILLALLSLTKFTFLLFGAAAWAAVVLAPGLSWRRRAALAGGYPLICVIVWLLLGQSLGNVPPFLRSSWEIARGYGEAMAGDGNALTLYVGLTALVVFFALLLAHPFSHFRRRENLLGFCLLSASMFLVWKHGFTRQDQPHEHVFFGYLLLVPFAVIGFLGTGGPPSLLRTGSATVLVIIGILYSGPATHASNWLDRLRFNAKAVWTPIRLKRALDQREKALAAESALPSIQRLVGKELADFISLAQGLLLLNGLNYLPRPVFQSYSAYTPHLLERNAAFYRSERAPRFVLCRFQAIDDHFLAMEDGPALLELFRRYRPVASEKGILLLKRLADAGPPEASARPVLLHRLVAFDQEVQLDEFGAMPKLLSVQIDDSRLGGLRKTVFRPPPILLKLHSQDGGAYSYRLIPGMAGSEFLLDPLLRDHEDIEAFFAGSPLPRVRSFSFHVDPDARIYFQERIEITLRSDEGLAGISPIKKQ